MFARNPELSAEEAVTRSNLGYAYMLMGNYLAALKELDPGLATQPKFDRSRGLRRIP